jgi:hypothetical protein
MCRLGRAQGREDKEGVKNVVDRLERKRRGGGIKGLDDNKASYRSVSGLTGTGSSR